MSTWAEVRSWRRGARRDLLRKQGLLTEEYRNRSASVVADKLSDLPALVKARRIGFYWPFEHEIDLIPWITERVGAGAIAALPVIVDKDGPLEFWAWSPGMKLEAGVWNTRVPARRHVVVPEALLIPALGFDASGYRLGHGGGYYDRTLASLATRPLAVGIGYRHARLATIFPQPHDVPMDVVVTEAAITRLAIDPEPPEPPGPYASSPCFMHEFE